MRQVISRLLLGLLLMGFHQTWGGVNSDALFKEANQAYKSEDYDKAEALYQLLIDQGIRSADIYYNLGNAFFRQQDFTRAILNYERALRIRPGDPDIRYNLNLANGYIKDDIVPAGGIMVWEWWKDVAAWLPSAVWLLLHLVFFVLCALLTGRFLVTRSQRKKVRGFRGALVSLGVALLLLALSVQAHFDSGVVREAIITSERAIIQSGPASTEKVLGEYHPGTKVRVLKHEGGWLEVRAADGHIGWVQATDLEVI